MTTLITPRATSSQRSSRNGSLTGTLKSKLANPASSPEFDLLAATNEVLSDVGLTTGDSGGRLSFYGQDPIIPSSFRFGAMAAIGLAAKSVAAAAVWRARTGQGQDIQVDVRKALRRFCGFFEGKWETVNGRGPAAGAFVGDPFLEMPLFRETRDGRHVVALNFYPKLKRAALKFLRCTTVWNPSRMPSCNGVRKSWRRPRPKPVLSWPWCERTRSFSRSLNTPRCFPRCR